MKTAFFAGIIGLAGAALLGGCASQPKAAPSTKELPVAETIVVPRQPDPSLLKPAVDPFVLGAGDTIDIELIGAAAATDAEAANQAAFSRSEVTVGPDGKIYFMYLPGLNVSGLTLAQAKARLESELSTYITKPEVTLNIRKVQSRRVWLMGRLNQPGIYPLTGTMTLIEAITLAGGTSQSASVITTEDLADLRHSFVLRDGVVLPVDFQKLLQEGDMSQNIYLRPNDFIFVPSALAKDIYVLGAVPGPGPVPYRDNLTILSAMSKAGGLIPKVSHGSKIAIVRGSLTQPKVILVDFDAIMHGRAKDMPLEPRDIVYVPDSPYKTINRYVDMILNSFVGTVAANEGSRAVNANAGNVVITTTTGGGGTSTPIIVAP